MTTNAGMAPTPSWLIASLPHDPDIVDVYGSWYAKELLSHDDWVIWSFGEPESAVIDVINALHRDENLLDARIRVRETLKAKLTELLKLGDEDHEQAGRSAQADQGGEGS